MLVIRQFEAKDNSVIRDIEKICPQGNDNVAMGVDKGSDIAARYDLYDNSKIMVAEEEGEVVGWIGWTLKQHMAKNYVYLAEVNVHPDHQGQGIATKLVQEVEADARKQSSDHIYCYIYEPNKASRSLFASMDYKRRLDVYSAALSTYKTLIISQNFKIKKINKKEIPDVVTLINDYYDDRKHFIPYTPESFQKYVDGIKGYGMENFYVVKNNNKIVACGGLWDCSQFADFCFAREPTSWKVMKGVFDFFRYFTKVPYIPGEGEFFQMHMISDHAYLPEHSEAIKALISYFNNLLIDAKHGFLLATLDPHDPLIADLKDFNPQVELWSVFAKSISKKNLDFNKFYVDVRDLIP